MDDKGKRNSCCIENNIIFHPSIFIIPLSILLTMEMKDEGQILPR